MKIVKKLLLLIIFLSCALPAWGSAKLAVWPVRIDLTPDRKIGEVNLRNDGVKSVNVQVHAKTWDMDENGKYIEKDTGDFVFFPRLLTIPAGEKKALRVGYNGSFPPVEKPYRLFIQELPDIKKKKAETEKMDTSFNFLLKLSVPIFVSPSDKQEPVQAEIASVKTAGGKLNVKLKNNGNRNFLMTKFSAELRDKKNKILDQFEESRVQRLLPKRGVFIDLPLKSRYCKKAKKLIFKLYLEKTEKPLIYTVGLKSGCIMTSGDPVKVK